MSYGWAIPALLVWTTVLILPWRPWSTRERLQADPRHHGEELGDVTVLIPARNEAASLPRTLSSLAAQGQGLEILVVDDQSGDATGDIVRRCDLPDLKLIPGKPLPGGWTGKVWAQAQAYPHLNRPLTLLLDADIELAPGLVASMRRELRDRRASLLSLMAELPMEGTWERLLLPAFVYFFKLLYPFRLVNSEASRVAAAAGGCLLVETTALATIGGFGALRDALIDDCRLARLVKQRGNPIWIGLTRSAKSHRCYRGLGDIWRMVARTAFTQLRYSWFWLGVCTALMVISFVSPLVLLFSSQPATQVIAGSALVAMGIGYLPTLTFYRQPRLWAVAMPVVGFLFLAMTWDSAWRYWRGERSAWRGRKYNRSDQPDAHGEVSSSG